MKFNNKKQNGLEQSEKKNHEPSTGVSSGITGSSLAVRKIRIIGVG